jgi:hypothetical protein
MNVQAGNNRFYIDTTDFMVYPCRLTGRTDEHGNGVFHEVYAYGHTEYVHESLVFVTPHAALEKLVEVCKSEIERLMSIVHKAEYALMVTTTALAEANLHKGV